MKKILLHIVFFSLLAVNSVLAASKSHSDSHSDDKDIKTEHLVEATLLFDEIYDIDISEGHFRVSVEILMAWEGETEKFLNKFGDTIIHGSKMEEFMEEIWYPEFFVSNAENPRVTHHKTLDVIGKKYELFERFEADLSIDGDMKGYPFGTLDLFMDVAAYSGNVSKMIFKPVEVSIGHHDAHHRVIKGNWVETKKFIEEEKRTSLNHGGKEKFSYLISHVNVAHNPSTAIGKILFPLFTIIIISLIVNYINITYEERLRSQITLLLIIPALKFALEKDIPTTSYVNFTDGLFILASALVFSGVLITAYANNVRGTNNTVKIKKVERLGKIIVPTLAGIFLIILIFSNIIN